MFRREKLEELKKYIEELRPVAGMLLDDSSITQNFISIKKRKFLLNNGKEIIREEILKSGESGSAAIVLPITIDNEVVLVVEPRVFTKLGVSVSLPAGYIDNNEQPIEGAKRELKEETGYVSNQIHHLTSFYQDQGCSRAYNHSYLALQCEKTTGQSLDADEYIRLFCCTYEEMQKLVEMGYINDSNSIITIEKSKQLFLKGKI